MLDQVISGLIVAAVGAYTYLAYNHPQQFRATKWFVGAPIIALSFGATTWRFATDQAYIVLSAYIPIDKMDTAKDALGTIQADWRALVFGPLIAAIYLAVLEGVATLKNKGKDKK